MANIGLDNFLGKEEKKLVDLDWLDIKEEDYINLPFDPIPSYIAEPKLVEQWSHTEDSKNIKLVPNSEFNFNYNKPNRLSRDIANDVVELLKFTTKEMMSGKTGEDLIKAIKEKGNPLVIKAAKEHLQKISKEQGLLGGVYVDPTVFNTCSEGSIFVAKKAKTAKYVQAMSACSNCISNDCGRCGVYKKRIASEITYDQELFDFYSKHISSLLGRCVSIGSKDDLQKAFSYKRDNSPRIAEFKPKISKNENEKEKSLENKKEEFENQIETLKKELSNILGHKIAKDISKVIFRNHNAKVIKDYVSLKYSSEDLKENKDIFNYILSKQGSLGRVFVEADMFSEDIPLSDNLTLIPNVKYIILRPNSPILKNPDLGRFKNRCRGLNKIILDSIEDIPKEAFLNEFVKYPEEITSKLSFIFEQDPIKGIRLAFIQSELANRKTTSAPIITENFDLQAKLDINRYDPKMKVSASLTPKKIAFALDKGFPLSSIIKTGRKLGVADRNITIHIIKAFEDIVSIHKRQLDIPFFSLPKNVKIKVSQRDISFDLDKKINEHNAHDISFNSSQAPVENLVNELGLKEANLCLKDLDKKSTDINILELNEFTI